MATTICLCVLILSGAVACLALAFALYQLGRTLKNTEGLITSMNNTTESVNDVVEDVKDKLNKLNEPVNFAKGSLNDGFYKTGLSTALGAAKFALKRYNKKKGD